MEERKMTYDKFKNRVSHSHESPYTTGIATTKDYFERFTQLVQLIGFQVLEIIIETYHPA